MRVSTALGFALGLLAPGTLTAQAPLATDDAAVAQRHRLHFEIFDQHSRLARAERPLRAQNTLVLTTSYGLSSRLEIGFDVPWIAILPRRQGAQGLGDLNLTAKWLWRQPAPGRTGFAVTGAVELPTGDEERSLGAGVLDTNLGFAIERELRPATTWRGNLGIQFGGNTLTGVVGGSARGQVLSAATSVTRRFGERWSAAVELSGYEGREAARADRELRAQVAGVFAHSPHLSIAVALQRGWQATPPWTLQIGLIVDP